MGSKKHKKESKKKKHRSRSRSPIDGEDKDRKRHHKRHKERKKDRSPDVEEVPVDSHLERPDDASSRSRSRSKSRDRRMLEERRRDKSPEKETSPVASNSTNNQESLSVEETNRLRAKLGLKPLEVSEKPADDGKFKDDLGEFYHKPASNIAKQKQSDKIKEKLDERREKRKIEQKLQTKLLAEESDGEDDAAAWVNKSRDMEKQKKEAAKRAAMLDEMDEVFGVSSLVAEDARAERDASYSAHNVRGLRVAHDINQFEEESSVILTLADQPVLADTPEDVLVNVNMVDNDRYRKNQIEKKKARTGYQAYDDEADMEAAALGYKKPVLAKYDDEINKEDAEKSTGFILGDNDALQANKFKEMMRRARIEGDVSRRLETLAMPTLTLASEYMNEDEVEAKFKKFKKKGKKAFRKKAKTEPIDVEDYDPNNAPLETDDTEIKMEDLAMKVEEDDEVEPDSELQQALARARRLRQAETTVTPKVENIVERVRNLKEESADVSWTEGMVVDATAEFCRALGDVPGYGAGYGAPHTRHDEPQDMEEDEEAEPARAESPTGGAWARVDLGPQPAIDGVAAGSSVALDAEPALDGGVAGALRLALSKGYLERTQPSTAARANTAHLAQLAARHYSIDDKTHNDDDKHSRRERGYINGPLSDFREKTNFRPTIKLEYVDDDGHALCPKEAFRYLSHKFHGKGPGKNKQEKRIKKQVQEGLMKKMSSTDTPLNTLSLLQEKQKETHSPFIVLSGLKKETKM